MPMARHDRIDGPRKATNVSLNSELVEEAKRLGINVSRACEEGLARQVKETAEEEWLRENKAALDASNEYVRKHGLPLDKYRQF